MPGKIAMVLVPSQSNELFPFPRFGNKYTSRFLTQNCLMSLKFKWKRGNEDLYVRFPLPTLICRIWLFDQSWTYIDLEIKYFTGLYRCACQLYYP